jgi:hypothetical protein
MLRGRRNVILVLVFLFLGAAGFVLWKWRAGSAINSDPRLTFVTPYRNVRPDIAYVGDLKDHCLECSVIKHSVSNSQLTV